jgi:hypothetical protein
VNGLGESGYRWSTTSPSDVSSTIQLCRSLLRIMVPFAIDLEVQYGKFAERIKYAALDTSIVR